MSNPEFSTGLNRESSHDFKFIRQGNGCEVTIDITDDRNGRQFCVYVSSHDPKIIYSTIVDKLRVILQRKEQARRATGTLHRLATR